MNGRRTWVVTVQLNNENIPLFKMNINQELIDSQEAWKPMIKDRIKRYFKKAGISHDSIRYFMKNMENKSKKNLSISHYRPSTLSNYR